MEPTSEEETSKTACARIADGVAQPDEDGRRSRGRLRMRSRSDTTRLVVMQKRASGIKNAAAGQVCPLSRAHTCAFLGWMCFRLPPHRCFMRIYYYKSLKNTYTDITDGSFCFLNRCQFVFVGFALLSLRSRILRLEHPARCRFDYRCAL